MATSRDEGTNPYEAPKAPLNEAPTTRRKWYQVSLVEIIVILVIIGLEVAILLPAVQSARSHPRRLRRKP